MRKHASLIYADMDGLKKINDTYGHNEGSLAITKVAEILRQTFRESDIIARLGGDEFTILATGIFPEKTNVVANRLEENLANYNAEGNHQYDLSLSFGIINIDPDNELSVEELVAKADEAMYKHKRSRRKSLARRVEV
ncbi:MAG: GGDEF domain-containing protein [Pyrinomonadaceae bacterium]|jgi:diguanylate cyclase (GGDEF)-like protein|nr:GGDEF domain-containing protein [Pyrinomonadaceae bacterium]